MHGDAGFFLERLGIENLDEWISAYRSTAVALSMSLFTDYLSLLKLPVTEFRDLVEEVSKKLKALSRKTKV